MTHYRAVIVDWAGTIVDFGSLAPTEAFIQAFAEFDVSITASDARKPMGLGKRDHLAQMLGEPHIARAWRQSQGVLPAHEAIDRLYAIFEPINERIVCDYAELVPGGAQAIESLRAQGLKIGSTTGYTRAVMTHLFPLARSQGFSPDDCVCADDVPQGRPGPLAIYQSLVNLMVYPPSAVVKVDDTAPGIAEGMSAGCLTVGVTLSGNSVGKTADEVARASEAQRNLWRKTAENTLIEAGADHTIDTIADLPTLLDHLTSSAQ